MSIIRYNTYTLITLTLFSFVFSMNLVASNYPYIVTDDIDIQNPKVKMTFENEHISIGKVKRGEKKKFDFVFTNTGSEDIEIDIVSGCDCTTLDWPRKLIKVGQKGTINVIFDSTKKEDSETVDIDIYLKNINPKTGQRILKIVDYNYELIK
jgi:hypothetical protein